MKRKTYKSEHKALYLTIVCFLLFSFACNSAPSVTATVVPNITATYTPSPTFTPRPTVTIQPSSTSFPIATPTPLIADLGQVIFSENFDELKFPFDIWGPARIESDILVLEREMGYKSPDGTWPIGGIYGTFPVLPDTTTIVLFKTTNGSTFNIGYHIGTYGTESLRRFSYNSGAGKWDMYKGSLPVESWNARQPNFETWHYFLIKRSANGDIDAKIWERDKPETVFKFHGNLGPEWETLELNFFIDYHSGSFMLDEYQDIK